MGVVKLRREVITKRDIRREVVLRKEPSMNYDRNVQIVRAFLILINIVEMLGALRYTL